MEIKEVTIVRVYRGTKVTKFKPEGAPTVALITKEYGDTKWISTFKVAPIMDSWKEGDKVTLDIEVTDKFINFKLPEGNSVNVEARLKRLEKSVFGEEEVAVQAGESMEVESKGLDEFEF